MTTIGRPPRARKPGSGTSVAVKPHTRTPRGSNRGKRVVRVDGYKRGKPGKRKRKARPT